VRQIELLLTVGRKSDNMKIKFVKILVIPKQDLVIRFSKRSTMLKQQQNANAE
jgi:hypothetical protein